MIACWPDIAEQSPTSLGSRLRGNDEQKEASGNNRHSRAGALLSGEQINKPAKAVKVRGFVAGMTRKARGIEPATVTPAQAGVHGRLDVGRATSLGSRLRGNDEPLRASVMIACWPDIAEQPPMSPGSRLCGNDEQKEASCNNRHSRAGGNPGTLYADDENARHRS